MLVTLQNMLMKFVMYLFCTLIGLKSNILININKNVYMHGASKVHPVKKIYDQPIGFLFNFQYKISSEILREMSYEQIENRTTHETVCLTIEKNLLPQAGDVAIVEYVRKHRVIVFNGCYSIST